VIEYCVLRGISLFIKLRIDIPSEGKAIVQLINVKLSSLSKSVFGIVVAVVVVVLKKLFYKKYF
jgi:hypothetical protein